VSCRLPSRHHRTRTRRLSDFTPSPSRFPAPLHYCCSSHQSSPPLSALAPTLTRPLDPRLQCPSPTSVESADSPTSKAPQQMSALATCTRRFTLPLCGLERRRSYHATGASYCGARWLDTCHLLQFSGSISPICDTQEQGDNDTVVVLTGQTGQPDTVNCRVCRASGRDCSPWASTA
jgi:hypothetical protein